MFVRLLQYLVAFLNRREENRTEQNRTEHECLLCLILGRSTARNCRTAYIQKNRRHECSPCTWGSDPWLVRGFHIWRMGEVGPPPGHCQGDQVVFSHVNLLAYFHSKRFVTQRASERLVLVW